MPKRWSKLQSQVESIFMEGLPLRIHCSEIRPGWDHKGLVELGTISVRLGKKVIWDFPKQFVTFWTQYPDGGNQYSYSVSDINRVLREYLDTPKSKLPRQTFSRDYFGITDILKAADRRLGIERLEEYFSTNTKPQIQAILEKRRALTARHTGRDKPARP